MALIDQIGCEGFVDAADVQARTDFTSNSTIETKNVLNLTGEKWFRNSAQFTQTARTFTLPAYVIDAATPIQAEMSFAWYHESTVNQTGFIAKLGTGFSNTSAPLVQIDSITSLGNPSIKELALTINTSTGGTAQQQIRTGVFLTVGQLMYVVLRKKMETTSSGVLNGDGAVELFINNTLVASAPGISWATDIAVATGSDGTNVYAFIGGFLGGSWSRNYCVFDAWTSADGVKPPLRHVIDGAVSDVTVEGGTTWTNEGGAATDIVALSDSDDDTYVQTTEADAHTVVGFDRPVGLTTQPTLDAVVRTRGSRGTSLPNTIAVAIVTDNTGATETSTTSVSLSTVGASRENIQTVHQAVGGTKMFVKVTNGS